MPKRKGLSFWGAEHPAFPHASVETAFVQRLCKSSSYNLRSSWGLCPPWSHWLCLALWLFAGKAGGEAALKNWTHVCAGKTCSALGAPRFRCRQEQHQPCLLIQFAKSLRIPSPRALFLKSSQHYLELLWQNKPLCWSVVVLFICSFLWLERKISKNEKRLAFPIALSLVVIIFEAILVSLCVPLNYLCICSAFSGLSVWNISKEDSSVSDGVNALFVCILKFK